MPIYEYECGACGKRFERLQKISDPDPGACPNCNATQIQKCVTAPSFRLAGTGWYETDFKKDGDKKRNLAEKSETGTGGEGKSESKPVEKKADAPAAAAADKPASAATGPTSWKPPTNLVQRQFGLNMLFRHCKLA